MKLTSRGFTLVELMIVIAIIGILAAALFPSMTSYLKRSRDTARISNLKDITSAIGAFYADTETYPDHVVGCVNSGSTGISTNYMPKGVPIDPQGATRYNGCGAGNSGQYGYGSGIVGGVGTYAAMANLENGNGGNTGSLLGYTGTLTINVSLQVLDRGSGSGYVLAN